MKHSRPSTRIFGDVLVLALQITGPLGVNVRSLLICVIHLARTNDDFPPDPNADLPGLSEMYRREAYRGLAQVWVCGTGSHQPAKQRWRQRGLGNAELSTIDWLSLRVFTGARTRS